MQIKKSLNIKFIIGFTVVLTPLVILLFYVTYHSMDVIREQVSQSNHNLLSTQIEKIDSSLQDIDNYIYKTISYNADIASLAAYSEKNSEYIYAKYNILNTFQADVQVYPTADAFFIYVRNKNDLFGSQQLYVNYDDKNEKDFIRIEAIKEALVNKDRMNWEVVKNGEESMLLSIQSIDNNIFVGAYLNIENLISDTRYIHLGEKGVIGMSSSQGEPLTNNVIAQKSDFLKNAIKNELDRSYKVLNNPIDNNYYLTIGLPSKLSKIFLVAIIPEKNMLQSLINFKRILYVLPVFMVIILVFYIAFLHKVLIKPINYVTKGIDMVSKGNWDVKLPNNLTGEFSFITENFNEMVSQINNLKINVYEEKIRTHQAEYKHLQLQINPHFYMNTLNVIYNLAALKEYKAVQKMALHLANYFRFIIQTKRNFVHLSDEMSHTQNYLEIQKLRFPDKLTYEIIVPPEYSQFLIPPLTIQTFVENCIIHGFEKRDNIFHVEVLVKPSENNIEPCIEIIIKDNGKGFSRDMLNELQSGEYFSNKDDTHIGLKNAVRRLKMKYDNKIVIVFENGQENGALIHLIIPEYFIEEERDIS